MFLYNSNIVVDLFLTRPIYKYGRIRNLSLKWVLIETVFLTASVNKEWPSQLMLGINRDGCFLCLPQSCKKRPQLIHFVVVEGDGEMPSGVGLWKIPRDGSALASRIERLLDCNFKGFLQIISIHGVLQSL
jgi:hypothetical protein